MSVSQPKGAVQCSPRLFSCKQQEKNRGSKRHARKINGKIETAAPKEQAITGPSRSEMVASVKHARRNGKTLAVPAFPTPYSRYPAASGLTSERGRSSVVERQLPKLYVEGSIPFARSNA